MYVVIDFTKSHDELDVTKKANKVTRGPNKGDSPGCLAKLLSLVKTAGLDYD